MSSASEILAAALTAHAVAIEGSTTLPIGPHGIGCSCEPDRIDQEGNSIMPKVEIESGAEGDDDDSVETIAYVQSPPSPEFGDARPRTPPPPYDESSESDYMTPPPGLSRKRRTMEPGLQRPEPKRARVHVEPQNNKKTALEAEISDLRRRVVTAQNENVLLQLDIDQRRVDAKKLRWLGVANNRLKAELITADSHIAHLRERVHDLENDRQEKRAITQKNESLRLALLESRNGARQFKAASEKASSSVKSIFDVAAKYLSEM